MNLNLVFPKAEEFIQGVNKMNNNQNYRSDIPKGRSTSRIKNASQSQGFANKDLYGPNVQTKSGLNENSQRYRQPYRTGNTAQRSAYGRNPNFNNSGNNKRPSSHQQDNFNKPQSKKVRDESGEMSESTMVKVIVGSILAAVALAVIIIVALCFMDFQL